MSNTVLTIDQITRECLMELHNNLTATKNFNRQYDASFAQSGAKIGDTLRIRLPNRYVVNTGAAMNAGDVTQQNATLTVSTQAHVDMSFSSADMTLSVDEFRKNFISPAMSQLASYVDYTCMGVYKDVYQCYGTQATTPSAMLTYLTAASILDEMAVPRDGNRFATLNPAANAATINGLSSLFNSGKVLDEQYRKGLMVDSLGMIFNMTQNVNVHTFGDATVASSVTVSGTCAEGATTIALTGLTDAKYFLKGDIIQVTGVYSVNPETRQSTGRLQQFVVTADSSAVSGNAVTLSVSPQIYSSGALQTVNRVPTASDAVTIGGAVKPSGAIASTVSPQNLIHHRDAFVMATADLELPPGGSSIASRHELEGISLRLWRQGDIYSDQVPCRIDVLFGYACVRPEMAVRLVG